MMSINELEEQLRGGVETPSLDVKAASSWNALSLSKDIIAMSNVRDGGYIVIGVEDRTFKRQGITADQKTTYDIDTMRDQMAKYADPKVVFTVEFPKDQDGLEYAVIRVLPFDEVPVICAAGSGDLRKGVLYYRNTNAKVESAAVSNANDMRDIITTATQRMMRRLGEAGFSVVGQAGASEQASKAFAKEREGL